MHPIGFFSLSLMNELKRFIKTSMDMKIKIAGSPLPDMPWEDRPEGCKNVMWRYSANPVIPRDLLPDSNSIFNSAIVDRKSVV